MTNLHEDLTLTQPDFHYNGEVPADEDILNYTIITVKGRRLA